MNVLKELASPLPSSTGSFLPLIGNNTNSGAPPPEPDAFSQSSLPPV